MRVCIAEKPSVAKEIASIIGAKSRMDGYYEGNGFQVTWTFGHLCTLKEPHDYTDKWKYWDMRMLPMLPERFGIKLINDNGVKKQFGIIEKLVNNADEVINCGDAGQEGELIQRWVLSKAGNTKPLRRLWISSLTEEAIREGFEHLRDGHEFDNLYAAGSARAIGDWLLGMNATRLYTLKYGQNKQVLSIGRVQTPTLSIIVTRQLEIDNFKPEPYWELKTKYREVIFGASSGRFATQEEAAVKLAEIIGYEFFIVSYDRKTGNEAPLRLFDLTSLQVDCNRKFGFTAEETLRLIQSLYEKKLTTYPRVDTTYLSEDIYPKVPDILAKLTPYQEFTEPLLAAKIKKSPKIFDDKKITDHHAIIPTGVLSNSLNPDERKVYDMVARRFISAFYPDCKVANITVLGEVNRVEFKATGKQILEPGWRVVYKEDAGKASADENILPLFEKGEHGPHEPELGEKMTQPPKHYTEATLLRAMETAGKSVDDEELRDLLKQNGIGRPSTRANIIETLFRRKYIRRDKKKIIANPTGVELIQTIENELLKSAELTGIWEKKLREIEAGKYEISAFMVELKEMVTEIVNQVKQSQGKVITVVAAEEKAPAEDVKKTGKENKPKQPEVKDTIVCPKCKKGEVIQGKQAWGCTAFRDGCDFRLPFDFEGKKLSETNVKALCRKGRSGEIRMPDLDGKVVTGNVLLNSDLSLSFEPKAPEELHCPRCKKGLIIKGKTAWGCAEFRSGCLLRVPFSFMGKDISDSQLEQLILKGKTNKIVGFANLDGSKRDGKLLFDKEFRIILE
ncbi:MAG TPA: DNA topoisomerase 3 [Prolixibacteraceae bacterium]